MKNETAARVAMTREEFAVSKFLATVRFPRGLLGLREDSVWQAMEQLVMLYEEVLKAERRKRELAERKLEALLCREEKRYG